MTTTVVNIKTHPEVRSEPDYVPVHRPTFWGNPFIVGTHGDRTMVISRYEAHVRSNPEMLARVRTLKDKRLGCYCAPKPCHGDVLARIADSIP